MVQVGIFIGSISDEETVRPCADVLKKLGVSYRFTVSSAHRTPARTEALVEELEKEFWKEVRIPGTSRELNQELEKAIRVADFFGLARLMITDGLDRDSEPGLEAEADRLHRSCRRLIWLNPLLRWEGFQPRAQGRAGTILKRTSHITVVVGTKDEKEGDR